MKTLKDKPIGLIVAENLEAAQVFEAHGMDFCCHGRQTLEEACRSGNVTVAQIEGELAKLSGSSNLELPDVHSMTLDELTRHIVSVHHSYTKKALLGIAAHLDTVVRVHGDNHSELNDIRKEFIPLKEELEQHLEKEEQILFPYIDALAEAFRCKGQRPHACFNEVAQPIAMMEHEHENAGRALDRIRVLALDYQPPADACNTYRLLLRELQELEQDLHVHIAKENYLLFPQAITLENNI